MTTNKPSKRKPCKICKDIGHSEDDHIAFNNAFNSNNESVTDI